MFLNVVIKCYLIDNNKVMVYCKFVNILSVKCVETVTD